MMATSFVGGAFLFNGHIQGRDVLEHRMQASIIMPNVRIQ